jgi:hypothetical protein
MADIIDRLRDEVTDADERLDATLLDAVAEIDRLREAIRRLADQDATLSVRDGGVTVEMDATLTAEEYLALAKARDAYAANSDDDECVEIAIVLRSLLERTTPDPHATPDEGTERRQGT